MRSLFLRRLVLSGCVGALFSGLIAAVPVSAFQEIVREEPLADVVLSSGDVTFVPRPGEKFLVATVMTPTKKILFGEFLDEKPFFSLNGNPQLEQEILNNGRSDLGVKVPEPEPKDFFPDGNYKFQIQNDNGQTQILYFCVEKGKILSQLEEEPRSEKKQ